MTPDLVYEAGEWDRPALETALSAASRVLSARFDLEAWGCTVLATDDAHIALLNEEFRDKPKATNVLSWPSQERAADVPGGQPKAPELDIFGDADLGDIALALETCAREAEQGGLAFEAHLTHLILHGMLHLLGYDHETDPDAELMEGIEVELLDKLAIANPYSNETIAGISGQG